MRTFILIGLALLAGCDDRKPPETEGIDRAPIETADPAPRTPASNPAEETPPVEAPPPDATARNDRNDNSADPSAIPAALRGQWTGLDERCGDRGAVLALELSPRELLFHESAGTVKRIEAAPGDATRVTADFTGEGESWTRTLLLKPSANGQRLTITQQGSTVTRKRCAG